MPAYFFDVLHPHVTFNFTVSSFASSPHRSTNPARRPPTVEATPPPPRRPTVGLAVTVLTSSMVATDGGPPNTPNPNLTYRAPLPMLIHCPMQRWHPHRYAPPHVPLPASAPTSLLHRGLLSATALSPPPRLLFEFELTSAVSPPI
jgi:hypothetical protein